jgi:hypothetical protein
MIDLLRHGTTATTGWLYILLQSLMNSDARGSEQGDGCAQRNQM